MTQARQTLPKDQLEKSFDIIDAVSAVYYVSHTAPAALLFQNGDKDAGVPRESAERLHRAASDPKTIRSYDGGHGLNNQAVLDRADWLRRQIGISPLVPPAKKE